MPLRASPVRPARCRPVGFHQRGNRRFRCRPGVLQALADHRSPFLVGGPGTQRDSHLAPYPTILDEEDEHAARTTHDCYLISVHLTKPQDQVAVSVQGGGFIPLRIGFPRGDVLEAWREVRRALNGSGPLAQRDWLFLCVHGSSVLSVCGLAGERIPRPSLGSTIERLAKPRPRIAGSQPVPETRGTRSPPRRIVLRKKLCPFLKPLLVHVTARGAAGDYTVLVRSRLPVVAVLCP